MGKNIYKLLRLFFPSADGHLMIETHVKDEISNLMCG